MVASWFNQFFWSLPLPLPLPLWLPLSFPLFLPFFPFLGAKSLPFWSATVKKECLEPGWNHSPGSVWLDLRRYDLHRFQLKAGIYCARRRMEQEEPQWKRITQSVVGQDAC